jgi:hypothetical protein
MHLHPTRSPPARTDAEHPPCPCARARRSYPTPPHPAGWQTCHRGRRCESYGTDRAAQRPSHQGCPASGHGSSAGCPRTAWLGHDRACWVWVFGPAQRGTVLLGHAIDRHLVAGTQEAVDGADLGQDDGGEDDTDAGNGLHQFATWHLDLADLPSHTPICSSRSSSLAIVLRMAISLARSTRSHAILLLAASRISCTRASPSRPRLAVFTALVNDRAWLLAIRRALGAFFSITRLLAQPTSSKNLGYSGKTRSSRPVSPFYWR